MNESRSTEGQLHHQEQEAAERIERGEAEPSEARMLKPDPSEAGRPHESDLGGAVVTAAIDRLAMELRGRKLTRGQRDRLMGLADAVPA